MDGHRDPRRHLRVQLLMIGILGEYMGRIYEEVKRRPLYVVREEINLAPPASAGPPGVLSGGVLSRGEADDEA